MNYLNLLKSLLPPGRAWTARSGSTFSKFLNVFANEMQRFQGRCDVAQGEMLPSTVTETIAEWEAEYGIVPGVSDTLAVRQARLHAKYLADGGQSAEYFLTLCAALGYNVGGSTNPHIRITQNDFRPFRVGISKVGDPVNDNVTGSSAFTWVIRGTNVETDAALIALFNYDIIPAHTEVMFVNE
jgi:uncharacterized protein YmfQ (DUF2313 family)